MSAMRVLVICFTGMVTLISTCFCKTTMSSTSDSNLTTSEKSTYDFVSEDMQSDNFTISSNCINISTSTIHTINVETSTKHSVLDEKYESRNPSIIKTFLFSRKPNVTDTLTENLILTVLNTSAPTATFTEAPVRTSNILLSATISNTKGTSGISHNTFRISTKRNNLIKWNVTSFIRTIPPTKTSVFSLSTMTEQFINMSAPVTKTQSTINVSDISQMTRNVINSSKKTLNPIPVEVSTKYFISIFKSKRNSLNPDITKDSITTETFITNFKRTEHPPNKIYNVSSTIFDSSTSSENNFTLNTKSNERASKTNPINMSLLNSEIMSSVTATKHSISKTKSTTKFKLSSSINSSYTAITEPSTNTVTNIESSSTAMFRKFSFVTYAATTKYKMKQTNKNIEVSTSIEVSTMTPTSTGPSRIKQNSTVSLVTSTKSASTFISILISTVAHRTVYNITAKVNNASRSTIIPTTARISNTIPKQVTETLYITTMPANILHKTVHHFTSHNINTLFTVPNSTDVHETITDVMNEISTNINSKTEHNNSSTLSFVQYRMNSFNTTVTNHNKRVSHNKTLLTSLNSSLQTIPNHTTLSTSTAGTRKSETHTSSKMIMNTITLNNSGPRQTTFANEKTFKGSQKNVLTSSETISRSSETFGLVPTTKSLLLSTDSLKKSTETEMVNMCFNFTCNDENCIGKAKYSNSCPMTKYGSCRLQRLTNRSVIIYIGGCIDKDCTYEEISTRGETISSNCCRGPFCNNDILLLKNTATKIAGFIVFFFSSYAIMWCS